VLVNGGAQATYFQRKRTENASNHAIFGLKTGHFHAKWDAQKSVNYILAAGINHARPFAAVENYSHTYL
jgi:hypothetical protein